MADLLGARIRAAYVERDVDGLGVLLADDVIWGDPNTDRGCSGRSEVLETFGALLAQGITADVVEVAEGAGGVMVELNVSWAGSAAPRGAAIYQAFLTRAGLVREIRGYDDAASARAAVR